MNAPLPPNPRAGTLRVDRAQAVERCARLLAADPGLGLDRAWWFVAGFELGKWKHTVGLEVLARMVELEASPNA